MWNCRRITIDVDERGVAVQASVAWYDQDEMEELYTWTPGPFDGLEDVLWSAEKRKPLQRRLFAREG